MDLVKNDRQWDARTMASELAADAIDSLMAAGMSEHDAVSALEDALRVRRTTYEMAVVQD